MTLANHDATTLANTVTLLHTNTPLLHTRTPGSGRQSPSNPDWEMFDIVHAVFDLPFDYPGRPRGPAQRAIV